MAQQVIDWRNTGGFVPRIRYAIGNNDAFDYSLGNEKIAFDSEWPEIIGIHDANYNATFSNDSQNGTLKFMGKSFPWLPHSPLAVAWRRTGVGNYPIYFNTSGNDWNALTSHVVTPSYRSLPCSTSNDKLLIQDKNDFAGVNYAYFILSNSLNYDTREDGDGSVMRIFCGAHPKWGVGLFVSRKNADVLTCPDYDLRLNSNKMNFQIDSSGSLNAQQKVVDKVNNVNVWGFLEEISLPNSYPDRPPVMVSWYTVGLRPDSTSYAEVGWKNDSTIVIRIYGSRTRDSALAANIRYWVPRYTPNYSGVDSSSVCRVVGNSSSLRISRHNVDARWASDSELLFSTSRAMVHVYSRVSANGVLTGTVGYSSRATGPPLVILNSYLGGRTQMSLNQAPGIFVLNNSNIGWSGSPGSFSAAIIDFSKYT